MHGDFLKKILNFQMQHKNRKYQMHLESNMHFAYSTLLQMLCRKLNCHKNELILIVENELIKEDKMELTVTSNAKEINH